MRISKPIHLLIMHALRFLLGRIAPLALINLILLACLVDGGPVNGDLWDDLGTLSSSFDSSTDLWPTDSSSTDADFFPWPSSSDPTLEDDNDLFLASNPSCHADAETDLTQFEPYSKLRAREACPAGAGKPTPPLALPSLDNLGNPDEGNVNVGDLNHVFRIVPAPQTGTQEDEEDDVTCPADKTHGSKVPVCDSGKQLDSHTLQGFAYSTLYNVQLCQFCHHAAAFFFFVLLPATLRRRRGKEKEKEKVFADMARTDSFVACPFPSTLWCCLTVTQEVRPY